MSIKPINNNYKKQLEIHNFIVTYIKKYIHINLYNKKTVYKDLKTNTKTISIIHKQLLR